MLLRGWGQHQHAADEVFLADPNSVVSASAGPAGIDGTVDIRALITNISGSLSPLPQGYLGDAALAEDLCAEGLREGQVSSFVVAGRDGMPLQPGGVLPSPLYEAGQVGAQGEQATNDARRGV